MAPEVYFPVGLIGRTPAGKGGVMEKHAATVVTTVAVRRMLRARKRFGGLVFCGLFACLVLAMVPGGACAAGPLSALTLRGENDAVNSTDANYTAGLSLGYTRNDSGLLGGLWRGIGASGRPYSSYELTQLLFTPSDLNLAPPDPHDRPYAGLLYLGLTTGMHTENSLQALKLLVGMVGPSSLGESGQKFTHRVLGNRLPQGWRYQLKDEPIFNLIYEYRHRYQLAGHDTGFGMELIPVGTAMAGNYLVKGRGEVQLRLGYRLPDDFGETTSRGLGALPLPENGSGGDSSLYLFAGGGGELVGRDLTLDGNTFRSGPGVDSVPFVSSALVGVGCRLGNFVASGSYIIRGREFDGQHEGEKYGSLALTYLFR
jgi:hypothetical protein